MKNIQENKWRGQARPGCADRADRAGCAGRVSRADRVSRAGRAGRLGAGRPAAQGGVVLLEVLVSLVVFVLGVMGMLGSMAVTARFTGENQFRAEAVSIADNILGTLAGLQTSALKNDPHIPSCHGASCTVEPLDSFVDKLVANLPQGEAEVELLNGVADPDGVRVNVTIRWKAPNAKDEDEMASYTTSTYFMP
jgi:type IV pilus assembly protein PilV